MNRLLRLVALSLCTFGAALIWLAHEMKSIEQVEI